MNIYLVAAAALAFVVGLVHSLLGETMVFSRMRQGHVVPTNGGSVLQQGHVRILWASWHVLRVFGWSFSALLFLRFAMLVSSSPVFYATNARHSGWVGLLGVAVLTWLGLNHRRAACWLTLASMSNVTGAFRSHQSTRKRS